MILTILSVITIALLYLLYKEAEKNTSLKKAYETQLDAYKKLVPELGSVIPMSHFRQVVDKKDSELAKTQIELYEIETQLAELKSQQQSKSVRLGLISENVLPFHSDFKYNVKDLVPMFRPIDYVVFAEDEIVFLEIKIGASQLSEKQRRIKNLIEAGKVRFEEHRVTEKGYIIKESNGKETQAELGSRV